MRKYFVSLILLIVFLSAPKLIGSFAYAACDNPRGTIASNTGSTSGTTGTVFSAEITLDECERQTVTLLIGPGTKQETLTKTENGNYVNSNIRFANEGQYTADSIFLDAPPPKTFASPIVITIANPTPDPSATPNPQPTPPCLRWVGGTCAEFQTAIGGVSTNPVEFIKRLFGLLLGLSGGIAVILIIVSGYQLMTSQGNKEAVQAARERITSAIVGLLFLIFALVILQVIGVDILSIPGFSAR